MIRTKLVFRDARSLRNPLHPFNGDGHAPLGPARDLGFVDLGCAGQRGAGDAETIEFGGKVDAHE